jgi:hypothetical protein
LNTSKVGSGSGVAVGVGGSGVVVGTTVAVGSIVAVGGVVAVGSAVAVAVGSAGVGVEGMRVDVAASTAVAAVGVVAAAGVDRVFVRSGNVLSASQAASSSMTASARTIFTMSFIPSPATLYSYTLDRMWRSVCISTNTGRGAKLWRRVFILKRVDGSNRGSWGMNE